MLQITTIETTGELIDQLYEKKSLPASELQLNDESCFFILQAPGQSALVWWQAQGEQVMLVEGAPAFQGIKPKDAEQTCLLFSFARPSVRLSVALGGAGSGKTTLALAYALHMMNRHDFNIVCCKPTVLIGGKSQAIAAITGDMRAKMAPYIESFIVAFKRILGDDAEHQMARLEKQGRIVFMPLELARGMQFDKSIIIVDEAQNTSAHSLLSIISRASDSCKVLVLGDHQQIDTGNHFDDTGLGFLISADAFYSSSIATGIKLRAQYRGELARLVSAIITDCAEQ